MKQAIKDWIKAKRDAFFSIKIDGKKTLGTEDSWTILTNKLNQPVIYSGGVGKNISFEMELVEKYGADIFLFDPSETGINTIRSIELGNRMHFFPTALSDKDGMLTLFFPVNPEEGSFTKQLHQQGFSKTIEFPCRSIPSLMNEHGHHHIDILKLDIEGSEYDVLENVLNENISIDQICVEFHHFFADVPRKKTQETMAKLKSKGFVMVHRKGEDYLFCHKRLLKGSAVEGNKI